MKIYKEYLCNCMKTSVMKTTVLLFILCTITGITIAYTTNCLPLNLKEDGQQESGLAYIQNLKFDNLIIDVDAGSDDAFGLLLAIFSFKHILAVTAVNGNTNLDQVLNNTLRTLKAANVKIPVYRGCHQPLSGWKPTDGFYGSDGLGDIPYHIPINLKDIEKEHAVLALIRLVNKYPNKITILALGPLTNIALAATLDPNFLDKVHAIVWTGASVEGLGNVQPGIEFNAYMDPMANSIVFNNTKRPIVVVSWELIYLHAKTNLEWRLNVLGRVNTPIVKFLNSIENYSLITSKSWAAADHKTAFVVVDKNAVTDAQYYNVEPITCGEHTKGLFIVDYNRRNGKPCNAVIVFGLDVNKFYESTLKAFSKTKLYEEVTDEVV